MIEAPWYYAKASWYSNMRQQILGNRGILQRLLGVLLKGIENQRNIKVALNAAMLSYVWDSYDLNGLELLGLDASACLAIEDAARGLAAARAAGLKCIVVPNTLTQDGDFSEAYAVLDDIRDVIPAVEKLLV